ncbi:Hydrogenobyrinate a,c-diamide synthase [uncultured Gammaproteobacteria bacterium]
MPLSPIPGLLLAAPASSSGKTTLTLALLRHLRNAGRIVAAVKAGPDYIDPAFHAAAGGATCLNLDTWAMRPQTLAALVGMVAPNTELILGEGVMGLFDGAADGQGSTAALALATGWPVVLVVDVRGQAVSAAATVHGFNSFHPGLRLAGVIFNRVGSDKHARLLRAACVPLGVPVLGAVRRHAELSLPDRHLGLVQAAEHPDLDVFLNRAAELVVADLDLPALLAVARPATLAMDVARPATLAIDVASCGLPPLGQRIAVAQDVAFAFVYPWLLASWRAAGAEVLPFSPLADQAPDPTADAVYLPGGYPELHAGRLAAATTFLNGVRAAAIRGASVFGECGGYMVLGQGVVDAAGNRHAMAGLLAVETSFARRKLHLGYRSVVLAGATPFAPAGTKFRGHEFHFASIIANLAAEPLFWCRDAEGAELVPAGERRGSVCASFIHLIDRYDAGETPSLCPSSLVCHR